jgi:hypothetical protein
MFKRQINLVCHGLIPLLPLNMQRKFSFFSLNSFPFAIVHIMLRVYVGVDRWISPGLSKLG